MENDEIVTVEIDGVKQTATKKCCLINAVYYNPNHYYAWKSLGDLLTDKE